MGRKVTRAAILAAAFLLFLAPAQALPAGKYSLVMEGRDSTGAETETARYPFTLRFE